VELEALLLVAFSPRGAPRFPQASEASLPALAHAHTAPLRPARPWLRLLFLRGKSQSHPPAAFLQGAIDPARKSAPKQGCPQQQTLLAPHPAPVGDSLRPASAELPWPPRRAAEGTGAAAARGAGPALA